MAEPLILCMKDSTVACSILQNSDLGAVQIVQNGNNAEINRSLVMGRRLAGRLDLPSRQRRRTG
jgi:hypothetical protein